VKPHSFHPEAESELLEQISYYETISLGLGERFMTEVIAALAIAGEFPKSGSPYYAKTRRVFPKSFQFSVVYYESTNELVVLAIASFRRRPGYWRNRQRES
jgi:ParE toxin of type II toxin-antitoxin system, parDE